LYIRLPLDIIIAINISRRKAVKFIQMMFGHIFPSLIIKISSKDK